MCVKLAILQQVQFLQQKSKHIVNKKSDGSALSTVIMCYIDTLNSDHSDVELLSAASES